MKLVVVSGKFDPIDAGHMALLEGASNLGNYVIVGLNSDEAVKSDKGFVYQSYEEREKVLKGIKYVNGVNFFDDVEQWPITDLLKKVRYWYPSDEIIYASVCEKGDSRDYSPDTVLSANIQDVKFMYNVGGNIKKREPEKRTFSYESWRRLCKGIGAII